MSINGILREKRSDILRIAAKHGARDIRVFGSAARGESNPNSDIDLLVDMGSDRSLFDTGELLLDLRELLGVKVDVVTKNSINKLIRRRILKEAVPL